MRHSLRLCRIQGVGKNNVYVWRGGGGVVVCVLGEGFRGMCFSTCLTYKRHFLCFCTHSSLRVSIVQDEAWLKLGSHFGLLAFPWSLCIKLVLLVLSQITSLVYWKHSFRLKGGGAIKMYHKKLVLPFIQGKSYSHLLLHVVWKCHIAYFISLKIDMICKFVSLVHLQKNVCNMINFRHIKSWKKLKT